MTDTVDIAEFVSDYYQMLVDCGTPIPPRKKLAKEIAIALEDYGVDVTPETVAYYL